MFERKNLECAMTGEGWESQIQTGTKGPLGLAKKNFSLGSNFSLAVFLEFYTFQIREPFSAQSPLKTATATRQ